VPQFFSRHLLLYICNTKDKIWTTPKNNWSENIVIGLLLMLILALGVLYDMVFVFQLSIGDALRHKLKLCKSKQVEFQCNKSMIRHQEV
jgi:peptidoglycan biosynthesis protein MviN/MurJ (putative lipid II flippase)